MKKLFLPAFFFIFCAVHSFSQMSVNPTHPFYSDVQDWYIRNVVKSIPPVRPYPVLTIKDLLEQVMQNGTEDDKVLAQKYYELLTKKALNVSIDSLFTLKHTADQTDTEDSSSDTDKMLSFYPAIQGDKSFKGDDTISFGYTLGFAVRSTDCEDDFLPYGGRTLHDAIQDPATAGSFSMYLDTDEVFSLGNKNIFLQGGIFRNGFGSFLQKGLALNDLDYHKGSISLTYMGFRLRYNQQINVIGASSSYDGSDLWPNKVLAFHALAYDFFDWLTVTYYENVIYGKRFDFSYILPVPYMACQGIGGNSDNIQMGLVFDVKPFDGLLWSTDLFFDDFDVNETVKLNFDTKLRLGIQTGIIYSPKKSFVKKLCLDWTLITPFTYSHWDYDSPNKEITTGTINYQNYTNSGTKMGSVLEPNSDGVSFAITLNPLKSLDITLGTNYIRHANVSESFESEDAMGYLLSESEVYATDGTVYQHTMFDSGNHVKGAWNKLNMFTQDHQMYTVQGTLSCEYRFPKIKTRTQISLKAGWTFEFIHNYGVDANIFPGGLVEVAKVGDAVKTDAEGNALYTYDGNEYTADNLVKLFKDKWAERLTDRLNNYFSLGLCARF